MDYFPVFLDLRGRAVLVVGGGAIAARKIELLLEAGARVRVVAPSLCEPLRTLVQSGRVEHTGARFVADLLAGAVLVIAATNRNAVNAEVAAAARERNLPVNVVDDAQLSSFIVPAIVDRSPVVVAIGTGGRSPVLARWVRARIEALLHPRLGRLADLAGRWRQRVKSAFGSVAQRRRFWEAVLEGRVAAHVLEGREDLAELELRRELKRAQVPSSHRRGEVVLVGAGPGDPDLLTLRGARELQLADVILYDRLVAPQILARARRDAERIFVGKEAGRHHLTQDETNDLMVRHALAGKRVVRLKGGDPFVFGRGGEELEVLARHGIAFSIVPGITAALGAAAAAGIPLTHRDHAHSVTFVTGHARDGRAADASPAHPAGFDWATLAREQQTVVFYMGVANLGAIVAQLAAHGAPPTRPIAIIENATLPEQRVLEGTLADIVARAEAAAIGSPALLVIGDVVKVRSQLVPPQAQDSTSERPSAAVIARITEARSA